MALPYPLRLDLLIGGQWSNVTGDLLVRDDLSSVQVKRGQADESSSIAAATLNLVLNNTSGKYSPRNPAGSLYGQIGRNTPIRFGLGTPPVSAAAVSTAGTSNLVAPAVVAEATGLLIASWIAAPVGNITVPVAMTGGPELDGNLATFARATQAAVGAGSTGAQTATFSTTATDYAALQVHVPGASLSSSTSVRGVLGLDCNLTPTVVAGQTLVAICAWSDDPSDRMQPPKIQGDRGLGWTLLSDSGVSPAGVPRIAAWSITVPDVPGIVSFVGKRDAAGDAFFGLYTLTGAAAYIPRFTGEVAEWPTQWNLAGTDVWAPIQAAGITRRLGSASQTTLRSAIYESFIRRSNTIGYWPLEDQSLATGFASALQSGQAATFVNVPVVAAYSGLAGSDPLPTFTAAAAIGTLGTFTGTGSYAFGGIARFDPLGDAAGANIFSLDFSGGDIATIVLEYTDATHFALKIVYTDGTSTLTSNYTHQMAGNTVSLTGAIQQSGTSAIWAVSVADITTDGTVPTPLSDSGTVTTKTVGVPVRINAGLETGTGATLHTNAPSFGHLFVTNSATGVFNYADPELGETSYKALIAWNNQKVSDRIFRLCCDNRVRVNVAHLDTDELMGNQVPNTLLGDLNEAQDTSAGGSVYDPVGYVGLAYRGRISKESRTARLTLDYAAQQISDPFTLTDDDQAIANDVTVSRKRGGSARAVLTSGPLSTAAFPDGIGDYRDSFDLSLFSDAQCTPQANWRLHLGTIDEPRWPTVTWELTVNQNSGLVAAMAYLDVGDTVRLANLPAWCPRGPVDLLLRGYAERFSAHRWIVTGNFSSATGYRVAELDDPVFGRLDAAAAHLQASATSTQTALLVSSLDSTHFTTTATRPGDFPFDIRVGGEVMTVTAITGTSNQTFTVVRGVNGVNVAHAAGSPVHVAYPVYVGL